MKIKNGFQLRSSMNINEIGTKSFLYSHLKTGAELLSLENGDKNKCFAIVFRTIPENSNGAAHVLEHVVLSGSKKYPMNNPLIELRKRCSLSFLNAFTMNDRTCFMCASTILDDFFLAVDVILDAVFNPLLSYDSFLREGWHYEYRNGNKLNGIVLNETRGAYSDPIELLSIFSRQAIFSNCSYKYESSGDPEKIQNLTWEEILIYWKEHYHPSNSLIYWYGDIPEKERLERSNEYLNKYDLRKIITTSMIQKKVEQTRPVIKKYFVENDEQNFLFSTNWLLKENSDSVFNLAFYIISHYLLNSPFSPLNEQMSKEKISGSFINRGFQDYLSQVTFSIGMFKVKEEFIKAINYIVDNTLRMICNDNKNWKSIEMSINAIDLLYRDESSMQLPKGLFYFYKLLPIWFYTGDAFTPLFFKSQITQIRNMGFVYLKMIIEDYLIYNSNKVTVLMKPTKTKSVYLCTIQNNVLGHKGLMNQQSNNLSQPCGNLTNTINFPKVERKKINKVEFESYESQTIIKKRNDCEIIFHDIPTDDVCYIDVGFNLQKIPLENFYYISLLGKIITDSLFISKQRLFDAGEISPYILIDKVWETDEIVSWFFLRGKVIKSQIDQYFKTIISIVNIPFIDNKNEIFKVVTERVNNLELKFFSKTNKLTERRLCMNQDNSGWIKENLFGFESSIRAGELAEKINNNWDETQSTLAEISNLLFTQNNMILNLTFSDKIFKKEKEGINSFIDSFPLKNSSNAKWKIELSNVSEGIQMPITNNYLGKGANIYKFGYRIDGSIFVMLRYLGAEYIWKGIRELGGAYFSGISFKPLTGSLNFISYRDPNILETIEIFNKAGMYLLKNKPNHSKLNDLIKGSLGEISVPLQPEIKGYKALSQYLTKYDDSKRWNIREQILKTNLSDFEYIADIFNRIANEGNVVVVGPKKNINMVKKRLKLKVIEFR